MTVFDHHVSKFARHHLLHGRYAVSGRVGREKTFWGADAHNGNRSVVIEEFGLADEDRQREAALLSSLCHPNLAPVYDVFSEQGFAYLVMDASGGKTLLQLLREHEGRPLPLPLVLSCARQLCDVLIYLARCEPSIIVRDLQLSSVLVSGKGQVYLLGLGPAAEIQQRLQQEDRMPSPASVPQEHSPGFPLVSHPALFSLGQLLHTCLTGGEPFHVAGRSGRGSLRRYNYQVPIELDNLIQRLLTHDERYPPISLDEVQQILMRIELKADEHTIQVAGPPYHQSALSAAGSSESDTVPVSNRLPLLSSGQATSHPPVGLAPEGSTRGRVWRSRFVALSTLALVLLLGASLCALMLISGSVRFVEFGWSIALLGTAVTSASSLPPRVLLPWALLLPVALLSLLVGLAFLVLASPAAQRVLGDFLQAASLEQIITYGLGGAALVSLLWLTRPFTWRNRLSLLFVFAIAGISALVQYALRDKTTLRQAPGSEALHSPLLLIVALALLVWGVAIAAHMERVRAQELPGV